MIHLINLHLFTILIDNIWNSLKKIIKIKKKFPIMKMQWIFQNMEYYKYKYLIFEYIK